jgi:hypothetical protein
MPKRRDDIKNEHVGLRMSPDLRERCKTARLAGAFKSTTESPFLVYLIEIGLSKYEKVILPQELDEQSADTGKRGIESLTA